MFVDDFLQAHLQPVFIMLAKPFLLQHAASSVEA